MDAAPPTRIRSVGWLSTQRLTLAPEALLTEARDPITGVWSPGRSLFYDEIRAVYTFRAPDWGYLVVAALYGLLGGLLLLVVGLAAAWSRTAWLPAAGALIVPLAALALYRVFLRQQEFVRVTTASGSLLFASRERAFLDALRGRLTEAPALPAELAIAPEPTVVPAAGVEALEAPPEMAPPEPEGNAPPDAE